MFLCVESNGGGRDLKPSLDENLLAQANDRYNMARSAACKFPLWPRTQQWIPGER